MASPEAIGTSSCHDCGEKVYVCINSGKFPYYRCPACGFQGQHHRHSFSGKFIREKVALFETEKPPEAPEKAVKSEPKQPAAQKSIISTLLG